MNQTFRIRKTDHFLLRQWERGFSDSFINRILYAISNFEEGRTAYIVSLNTLKRCGETKKRKNLVLVMDGIVGVTLFYVDSLAEYFSKKHNNTKYKII
jgi:hypothetical protein